MLSYDQVQAAIEQVSDQLEELVAEIRVAADESARAEARYKAEFAKARIRYRARCVEAHRRPNMDEVSDHAMVVTEDLFLPHLCAQNNLTTLREALRARQAQLDALRTLSASFRAAGG